jgi:hypothetical protein
MVENRARQSSTLVIRVEEILESLELVEDHQVRLEVKDRRARHQLPQFADESVTSPAKIATRFATQVVELACARLQLDPERSTVRTYRGINGLPE